jgi:hypothetical protein
MRLNQHLLIVTKPEQIVPLVIRVLVNSRGRSSSNQFGLLWLLHISIRNEVGDFRVHVEHVGLARVALVLVCRRAQLMIKHSALLVERQVNALAGADRERELVQSFGRVHEYAACVDLV